MRNPRNRFVVRFLFCIAVLAGLLALRPVNSPTPENCEVIHGVAKAVEPGTGDGDFVVHLANDDARYYINRGIERGLELRDLQESLEGQEITLAYVRHWSTLNLAGHNRHIARISVDGQEIYSEMQ